METNQFLDFEKNKVQVLTLDQLSRTSKETDVYGNPLKGIYHYDLLYKIIEMCQKRNYDVEVYDLFAAQNKDRQTPGVVLLPKVEEKYGERAVEAHILRRVYANIRIKNFDSDGYTTNLAVAFHQRGIQVGFGPNVLVCHNQCILNPDHYISTYSSKGKDSIGVDLQTLLDTVKFWIDDAADAMEQEMKKIELMKQTQCTMLQFTMALGLLMQRRVRCDTKEKEIRENTTYPLNQAQLSQFAEKMLLRYHNDMHASVWDLYNTATELYKADTMEIPNVLSQNKAMMDFLDAQFEMV